MSSLLWKKIRYGITLTYNLVVHSLTKRPWWNVIAVPNTGSRIILGALPLNNLGHVEALLAEDVSAVLTLTDPFEITQKGLFTKPVHPNDWKQKDVQQAFIETSDFKSIDQEKINFAVETLHSWLQAGKTVYIHCKAGRGRSATIVVCYLLKYGGMRNIDDAIAYVKQARTHININHIQQKDIQRYFKQV